MGLERVVSILQDKRSNYDTDLFMPIFEEISRLGGTRPYAGKLDEEDPDQIDMAYRVVADHIRTLTFAITDGGVPSNEGRGYVIRRILRRAIRYGNQKLNFELGFLTSLVDVVVREFGDFFPELRDNPERVKRIVRSEEVRFGKTLETGTRKFNQWLAKNGDLDQVPGEILFKLYDTHGFPPDLVDLMAAEHGKTTDRAGFETIQESMKCDFAKVCRVG